MTADAQEPTMQQLHEDVELLRSELAKLTGQLARVDIRTESHGQALDDIETYVTETAQLARATAEQAATTANGTEGAKTEQGVDMRTLVPWVENNITTLISRKVPTTDGAPKWCPWWWDHAEAIARLEAARQAWVALSGAGGTGLVTYFDYLDRVVLSVLTSETGPFARCSPRQHAPERTLGHTPPPPEVYGDPSTPAATHTTQSTTHNPAQGTATP